MSFLRDIIDKISKKPKDNQWPNNLPKINIKLDKKGEEIWRKYVTDNSKPEIHRDKAVKGVEIESSQEKSLIHPKIGDLKDIQTQYEINAENDRIDPNGMKYARYGQCDLGLCDDSLEEKRIFRCKLCHQWMCAHCLINHECEGDGFDHYGKITYLGEGRIRYQPKKR